MIVVHAGKVWLVVRSERKRQSRLMGSAIIFWNCRYRQLLLIQNLRPQRRGVAESSISRSNRAPNPKISEVLVGKPHDRGEGRSMCFGSLGRGRVDD